MPTSTRYNRLNTKQLHILKLIYKFRFVTAPLLTQYQGLKSRNSVHSALGRLLEQEYVGKRVSNNDTFNNKGSRYYLLPKALKLLKADESLNANVLHAMYKNPSASEAFIDQSIEILRVSIALKRTYPDMFQIFTKSELASFDYFPDPKPAIFLNRLLLGNDLIADFMLDVFSDPRVFIMKKRVDTYLVHFDEGEWSSNTDSAYPVVLLVCPNASTERSLQRYIEQRLDNSGIDDLYFFTTTTKALLASEVEGEIWSNVVEPEKITNLNHL